MGRRRDRGKKQAWTKNNPASAGAVVGASTVSAPVKIDVFGSGSLIDIQALKMTEALASTEVGLQESDAFMDIGMGTVKEYVDVTPTCFDLHRDLFGDLGELE